MPQPMVIPRGPQETVQQAAAACIRAFQAGVRRQRVELLLPLVGATDLDDWPGGIRQQFKVRSHAADASATLPSVPSTPAAHSPNVVSILKSPCAQACLLILCRQPSPWWRSCCVS